MKTFSEIRPGLLQKSSLALGFFDGVHPGHQAVIKRAVEEAKRLGATPAVITFKEHPRSLTLGKSPPLLTLPEQRLELCEELGIEAALLLSFTEELCRLSPQDYVQHVLVDCMKACSLSVGSNHRFGRNREGNPEMLAEIGKSAGYEVHIAPDVIIDGIPVSSSRIREALALGDVELCAKLLGRAYTILGQVVHGEQRGHALGFPTANVESKDEVILPSNGVYSAICILPDGRELPSVVNIGIRPTFGTSNKATTEVHILNFNEDLYKQNIRVRFLKFIRTEKKFSGVDDLKAQIILDCQTATTDIAAIRAKELARGSLLA